MIQELLTTEDILTLSGAVTATYFSAQTLFFLFKLKPKYVGFFISLLISYTAIIIKNEISFISCILALFNSFIIYSSAFGISEMTSLKNFNANSSKIDAEEIVPKKRYFMAWSR
ncbi:MAG: hypothetical protein NTX22_00280 [Ignavibacteriales bacterium]|nr:hypothetical protein [Ignavibacteriales bacterium]